MMKLLTKQRALTVNQVATRRPIVWAALSAALAAALAIALPSSSNAEPNFVAGRYVLPITHHDLYVSAPGSLGTTVTLNFRFKPIKACKDNLEGVLEYQLPPGYRGQAINEAKASCNKTIQCSGVEFRCVGTKQSYPMTFELVPPQEIKASGKSFSATYRYVSEQGAPSRTPILRRSSVGHFETVKESPDKKTRTGHFRIEP